MLENSPSSPAARLHRDIMQLIRWSYIVQAQDFIGLEKESASQIDEPLMRYGMDLVITGYSAGSIREMMRTVADAEFERRSAPVTVLRNMAATAPAFGMVGTLIGMVTILQQRRHRCVQYRQRPGARDALDALRDFSGAPRLPARRR